MHFLTYPHKSTLTPPSLQASLGIMVGVVATGDGMKKLIHSGSTGLLEPRVSTFDCIKDKKNLASPLPAEHSWTLINERCYRVSFFAIARAYQ